MTKILLTGGAGFMGSNMIHYLFDSYPDVSIVNLDKLTYAGNLENLKDIEKDSRYTFIKGDIADKKLVDKVFKKYAFDLVLNYAAETHVDRSILDPSAFLMTDVIGTYNLLEAVKEYQVPKMVQISTDEVFGSIAEGAFTEQSPFEPNSPYSASKAGGDHLCRAYYVTYNTPVIVTHSCNFYGPYQYPEKFLPLFITNLLEGKHVPVYGNGQQVREWIYTTDHCKAVDTIAKKGVPGEVYNIGTEHRETNMAITKKILALVGKDESFIDYVKDRPGHDVRYAIDAGKLRNALGWKSEVSFDEGLKQTVEWYETHRDWWEKIKSGDYLKYYQKQYGKRV